MKPVKPLTVLICFLILLATILLVAHSCNHTPAPVKKIDYKKTIDSLKEIDERHTAALEYYEKKNDSLTQQLAETEILLVKQKVKLMPLRKSVRTIVRSDWNKIPVPAKLERCDSLKGLVREYEAQLTISDSLTTEKINSLNQIIEVKDEQLIECSDSYDSLKQTLETSIEDNKTCAKDLQKLNRKMKRKKFFNKVLGTTAVIASAAGAILLTIGLK
jgi:hypothetical protein